MRQECITWSVGAARGAHARVATFTGWSHFCMCRLLRAVLVVALICAVEYVSKSVAALREGPPNGKDPCSADTGRAEDTGAR
jgi:hypothetical protein